MVKPALPTLIKLAQQAVEEVQQALAQNRTLQAQAQASIAQWQQEAATAFTSALAEDTVLEMQAAGAFNTRARGAIAAQEDLLRTLRTHADGLQQALQAAFAKQKRYEILAEQQALQSRKTAARKAQAALDDLRKVR